MAKQPKEWRDGMIVLPLAARPIKGRGHKRIRFHLDRPKADVSVRKWYVRVLRESQQSQYKSCDGPHFITGGVNGGVFLSPEALELYERNRLFWQKISSQELSTQSKAREDAKIEERSRRKQASQDRQKAAHQMGLRRTDLKRKLDHFSEMLASRDTIPLATEIVRAADASFLTAALSGAQLHAAPRTQADVPSGTPFVWHPGAVFHRAGVMAKANKDQDQWEFHWARTVPGAPAWPVFWLAVARCLEMRSLPTLFQVSSLRCLGFTIRTAADAEVMSDALAAMRQLEKLVIRVGDQPFTTLAMPAMPKLQVLAFSRADDEDDDPNKPYDLTVAGLQKQPLLRVISIHSAARVHMTDDQLSLVNRIRFESTTLSLTNPMSTFTQSPPALPSDIVSIDRNAARAFVCMATDHSRAKKKPLWWRAHWRSSKRWADSWQPTWTYHESGAGRIHLPRCEELAPEAARVVAVSGLSLLISARCITADVASELKAVRGRLGICGVEPGHNLPVDFSLLGADVLYVEILGPVTHELASRLAAFRGSTLTLACAELSAKPAAALAAYGGQLELATPYWDDSAFAVSADVASLLSAAKGRVRFMGIDDCPQGRWIIPSEACEILRRSPNVSLGDYRRRVFTKQTKAGLTECSVHLRACASEERSHSGLLECVVTTRSRGKARIAVKKLGRVELPGIWSRSLQKICEDYVKRGFRESHSVQH